MKVDSDLMAAAKKLVDELPLLTVGAVSPSREDLAADISAFQSVVNDENRTDVERDAAAQVISILKNCL
jgi:hypothetical protein